MEIISFLECLCKSKKVKIEIRDYILSVYWFDYFNKIKCKLFFMFFIMM